MLSKFTSWSLAILTTFTLGGSLLAVATPQPVSAACKASNFLGFPAWYEGVTDSNCNVTVKATSGNLNTFIWRIVMNVVEIVLVALGYISGFFIIYGGVLFITSNGKPERATVARKTVLDATIGLAIAMTSVAIVNFISGNIG